MTAPSKEQISKSRIILGNPYAFLDDSGFFTAVSKVPAKQSKSYTKHSPEKIHVKGQTGQGYFWIEKHVKQLQKSIWQRRDDIWPDGIPEDSVEMLDPSVAFKLIGFEFNMVETLEQYSDGDMTSEIAGIINRNEKRVDISRKMPNNTIRFTAAHELGHAVLHQNLQMHRDRPIDGSGMGLGTRDKYEKQADKFASYYLMPEKLVKTRFKQSFLCDKLVITEETAFAIDPSGSLGLLEGDKTLRELARIIAKAQYFNGHNMYSLADQFHVSVEAMAIRLEELKLITT